MDEGDELTLSTALTTLERSGYTGGFAVAGGMVHCQTCGHDHPPQEAAVEEAYRFEGVSDPDDMEVLFGLTCAECGTRGTLVAAYGPSMSADEAEVVAALSDHR